MILQAHHQQAPPLLRLAHQQHDAAAPVPCFGAVGGKAAGHTRAVGRMDSESKGSSNSTQG